MTAFVESCVGTLVDSAVAAERRAKGKPRAEKLLRLLKDKRNILVTAHEHPDPDALASALGMSRLLEEKLPAAKVTISFKGRVGGGLNEAFVKFSSLKWQPWGESTLASYDAILLLDTQPTFAYNPLAAGMMPFAVIDHHRNRGRKPKCDFCDIRTDVGATSSLIFSYFMEMEVPIRPDLGATLLFGIESDLAGAAGTPSDLDNIALSGLTLIADPRKLYQMRYVDLPQSYYTAYAGGLANAYWYDSALISHLGPIDSMEKPAVIADFLLRFDQVQWALVTAEYEGRLVLSLRTSSPKLSAGDMMRRLTRKIGVGGGHRTKAGGFIAMETGSAMEIERLRKVLRRRFLRALKIDDTRGQKLVPDLKKVESAKPISTMSSGRSATSTSPQKLAAGSPVSQ